MVIWTTNFLNPEKFLQTASGRLDLFSCLSTRRSLSAPWKRFRKREQDQAVYKSGLRRSCSHRNLGLWGRGVYWSRCTGTWGLGYKIKRLILSQEEIS